MFLFLQLSADTRSSHSLSCDQINARIKSRGGALGVRRGGSSGKAQNRSWQRVESVFCGLILFLVTAADLSELLSFPLVLFGVDWSTHVQLE